MASITVGIVGGNRRSDTGSLLVALSKGYFAEQDLEVKILHSTGQHLQLLLSGDVDVTTAASASVLKRTTLNPSPGASDFRQ